MNTVTSRLMAPTKQETLKSLKLSRDAAWFTLAAYHYLHIPLPSNEPFQVGIRGNELVLGDAEPFTGYKLVFIPGDYRSEAGTIVRRSFRYYIVDVFDTVKRYSAGLEDRSTFRADAAYVFCRHLRNAFAHGGLWNFSDKLKEPVRWRNTVLTQELHDTDPESIVSLFDIAQLAAELTLLVEPRTPASVVTLTSDG